MSTPLHKAALSVAAILATAAVSTIASTPAGASFPSTPTATSTLTASSDYIYFEDGHRLWPSQFGGAYWQSFSSTAKWSPDGSRAIFTDHLNGIVSVRYNSETDIRFQWGLPTPEGFDRANPTYVSDGSTIVFAQREQVAGAHWSLKRTASTPFDRVRDLTPDDGADYTMPDGGGTEGKVVFQKQVGSGTPEIWIWDGSGTTAADFAKVTDGTAPALSPDGTKVAYVLNGHIWKADVNGSNAVQVDTDPTGGFEMPTWSADGQTIAFAGPGPAWGTVRTVPASGGAPTATTLTGRPTYQSQQRNTATRLSGSSRWETANAVSQYQWKTAGDGADHRATASSVILSRSDNFADALGGAALAPDKQGPLLMTTPGSLFPATKTEIQRVLGNDPSKTVYILGGTGAISASVENEILAMGYHVSRLSGSDRYATALAIADAISKTPSLILAATGQNFPDALAAGAAAGSYNVPGTGLKAVVVLTADKVLPTNVRTYLDSHVVTDDTLYAIGGQAATATTGYPGFDIVGGSRFSTAEYVAEVFFGGHNYAGVATGDNWPDALAGGALMGTLNGPLLLTSGTSPTLDNDTAWHLSTNSASINTALVFGGAGVVNASQLSQCGTWISGPAGFASTANPTSGTATASSLSSGRSSVSPTAPSTRHRSPAELRDAVAHLGDR